MKKIIALLAAAILTAGLFSCGRTSTKTKELNDLQKELLAAEGLPTEADELTDSQLRSIQRIYKMITYLNEKYDEEFIYGGYLEPAANQMETLYAYPRLLGADYGRNTVTVRATKDGFTDDYSDRSIVDYAEKMANDFMKDYFKSDQVIAFFSVNACDIEKNEVVDGDFQWKLGVSDIIFVNEDICNAEQVEEFAVNYAKWLYEHELSGDHRINILQQYDVTNITYGEIADMYDTDYYKGYFNFGFDSDKKNVLQSEHLRGERALNDYSIDEFFSKYK
ncbi:hypothetical protein [Ruminococcus flavefaciens]|uniref:Lipoprotein n=1 Tax=Ruminococcus flavefaciens 007c TaxID=1341157 RepID=W7ULY1_RUMFL|nr:hypothetical protein [Ruminococcus flavefaciens]EWM54783.1 hypothetical protein RF007C_10620 [Ruminococcus flavefaciens 007c]